MKLKRAPEEGDKPLQREGGRNKMKISKAYEILEARGLKKLQGGKTVQPILENESGEKGLVAIIEGVHIGGLCGGESEYVTELYLINTIENTAIKVNKIDCLGEKYKFCKTLDFR